MDGLPTYPQIRQVLSLSNLPAMRIAQIARGYATPAEILAEVELYAGLKDLATNYDEHEIGQAIIELEYTRR